MVRPLDKEKIKMKPFINQLKPTIDSVLVSMFRDSKKVKLDFVDQVSRKLCVSLTKMLVSISKKKWLGIIAEFRIWELNRKVEKLRKQRDDLLEKLRRGEMIK